MRKRWKRSFVTALSMALAVGNCVPAMAAPAGWRESAAGWQYVNSNGSIQKGWFQDTKGDWYFLDYNTGIMKTGWIKPADGKWYFMDYHTGAMKTGWIKPMDGKWYYLNPNSDGTKGAMQTGWVQTPDKKWYYMDASGAMQTGTITVNNQVWTLDANGVWDGKAATSVTYVSTSSGRRPSGGGGSGSDNEKDYGYTYNKTTNNLTITKKDYDTDQLNEDIKNKTINDLTIDVTLKGAEGESKAEEVKVSGLTVNGNLYITEKVGEGTVTLESVDVNGDTEISGGGIGSIYFNKCKLRKVTTKKSTNPIHISFGIGTSVGDVYLDGGNVILSTAITIANLYTKTPVVVKGDGRIETFVIQSVVAVVLQVNVETLKIGDNAKNATVEVDGTETTVGNVEGDAIISGNGTIKEGYYNVTLVPEGGYWLIEKFDEKTGELLKDQKTEANETKILKVGNGKAASTVINQSFNPLKDDGSTFAGWKDENGKKVDLDNYMTGDATWYAMWEEGESATLTATEISATVVGTVTGAAVQASVEGTKASLQIASGAAAQAGIASGAAVELKEVKVTATVDGQDVAVTVTLPTTSIEVGKEFEVKFVDVDNKYEEVTIYVTIVIETTE